MDAIRNRILHEKARQAVHEEMIGKRMEREKQKLQEKLDRLRQKKIPLLDVRWISPEDYFEGEWWPEGKLQYTDLVKEEFPSCKCTKGHEKMTTKEYWTHRRQVNRYRRKKMNERALRILGPETCPWKGIAI
jgi:hypothetical protein